ncbi:MAG TPA: hypothetical protein VHL31_10740 [Geminicoccus sp.]|jgi:hypothetical protein|uniref:hypothetical protein n=1 Tax=Geminicoccus sp. TaxID=2024832 RepID=UPI002E365481|nr:hypothetical protein [Geminicoccus sp.]HEX2526757.1 hypothetical protein [Geminicoccus sp.]
MSEEFRQRFITFTQRMVALALRCGNEESTKLFLILPFLNFLGYDDRNPDESVLNTTLTSRKNTRIV